NRRRDWLAKSNFFAPNPESRPGGHPPGLFLCGPPGAKVTFGKEVPSFLTGVFGGCSECPLVETGNSRRKYWLPASCGQSALRIAGRFLPWRVLTFGSACAGAADATQTGLEQVFSPGRHHPRQASFHRCGKAIAALQCPKSRCLPDTTGHAVGAKAAHGWSAVPLRISLRERQSHQCVCLAGRICVCKSRSDRSRGQ